MNDQTYSRILTSLLVLVGISIAVIGSAAAQPADLVVGPGGSSDYTSIQNAVDNATSGDKINIRSGTYEQGIVIDKNIELVTSGDVTLDGNNIDTNVGIKINSTDVSIDGVEVARFGGDGIRVQGTTLDERTITLSNITARLNGFNNIQVRDNPTRTTVRLRDIRASDNNDGVGISISAENVSVKNTIVENHNDGGMRISAGSTGTVTIRNSTFSDNGDEDPEFPDDGVYIKSTQSVDIENVESYNNDESGIDIDSGKSISIKQVETYSNGEFRGSLEAGPFPGITIENTDAIDGGRTIELTDVRSTENGFGNIILGETADRDTAILRNVTSGSTGDNHGIEIKTEKLVAKEITASNSNDGGLFVNAGNEGNISIQNGTFSDNGDEDPEFPDDGVHIVSVESINIENSKLTNNDESGVDIPSDVQSGNITHSTILSNDGPEIINRGTDVIGARNNWWGDPAGPPEDEIRGNVAVGSPLSIPPGDDDSNSPTTVQLTNATISPTEVATDGSTHTLSFDVSNLSTDDQPDNFTITLPNNLTVDNANIEEAGGLSPDIRTSDNPITFSVDPVSPIQNPVNIRVELTLSQSSE
jgi:hypothetical protein